MLQTVGYSTTPTTKVARNLHTTERLIHIYMYIGPGQVTYFSCVRKRVVIRVREHDRFLLRLTFGNDFHRVLVDASLFH